MSRQSSGVYRATDSSNSQKRYAPKSDSQKSSSHQTLCGSFRTVKSGGDGGQRSQVVLTSRFTAGENGEWINKDDSKGSFVVYLPQDEAVVAGLGPEEGGLDPVESQRVVDLLNRELSRLLKLPSKDFWRQVATDKSLPAFLESFLKYRSRWYDFPHRRGRGNVAGIIVGEMELSRRAFMLFYRLSSNQDPGAKASDSLNPRDHGVLLQDLKFLDLPKLLDICAIFGHENEDLTRKLVTNAMKSQPHLHDEFPVLLSHFVTTVKTLNQRCSASLEVLLNSGGYKDQGSSHLLNDYLEIMDFINDSIISLDSFANAYNMAAAFFCSSIETSYGSEEFLATLAMLYDSFLPSLRQGFHHIGSTDKEKGNNKGFLIDTFGSLKLLSVRVVAIGWKLLSLCYLSTEEFDTCSSPHIPSKMFPANIEDPCVRADIIIETIRNLSGNSSGHQDSCSFIQAIEENHKIMARIKSLLESGWLVMDDEQYKFLSAILLTPKQDNVVPGTSTSFQMASNQSQMDEDAAILESKISQIRELFPDYGRGFLLACLEAYNHDAEDVIQRILEGTLHEELDISLEKAPAKSAPSLAKHDKGKGKLEDLEVSAAPSTKTVPAQESVSSSSSLGRFIRKSTTDSVRYESLNAKNDKELAKTTALISQMEYEDEYDDSFDELGLSVGDTALDEAENPAEVDSRRERWSGTEGSSTSSSANSKWNSRHKPQFYVKDGKNYSYKVEGAVAVTDVNEAKLVTQAQKELIHGLGRGGNIPLGAVKRLTDSQDMQSSGQETDEVFRQGGRGRGWKGGNSTEEQGNEEGGERGRENYRGGGGRRGRGRNNYRRDRGMSKQLAGLPAHYT